MHAELTKRTVQLARKIYGQGPIPLHRPLFEGNEQRYLVDCIESNFVSSVGPKVTEFEDKVADFAGTQFAIATVNGTAALHIAIVLAGVQSGEEVLTQALTFVATCNAISYAGARPVFIDVDRATLGLSPDSLRQFLEANAEKRPEGTFNKGSGKRLAACIPMHTFGFPCRIKEISEVCAEWGILLIEDAAESLGSYVGDNHTGSFGSMGTLSFNGNKVITTGGGGMILTNDPVLAKKAKHITTTAKKPHEYEFFHDELGYNYRLPNLNAALGCAQMENLEEMLSKKSQLATEWESLFDEMKVEFVRATSGNKANHWLNTIILDSRADRDAFLNYTNGNDVMTRPIWKLMPSLPMFKSCQTDGLEISLWLEDRVVNLPSSVPQGLQSN